MRRAANVDKNQPEIVAVFRAMGCSVQHLHAVGAGCPDLLIGLNGTNILVEVKTAKGKLEATQEVWHRDWRGQVCVVRTVAEAQALVERVRKTPIVRVDDSAAAQDGS